MIRHLPKQPVLVGLICVGALFASACASGSDPGGDKEPELPTNPSLLELESGWNAIAPGGETICAQGDPFRYFVRKGSVNKVVIDFAGGGACWSEATCLLSDTLFRPRVDESEYPFLEDEQSATGLYDHSRDDNPVKDWHHVFVPYCTGDLHWGDATQTYGEGDQAKTIHHRGAANTRAVLDWVYEHFDAPAQVFVTGWSAGGYGAALWAAHVRRHYESDDVLVSQFSDSAAGVIQPEFFVESVPNWEPESAYPLWIPGADPKDEGSLAAMYSAIAAYYPGMVLSQFNTAFDSEQAKYYVLLGGESTQEWSDLMNASIDAIESSSPNFAAFTAAGEFHTLLTQDLLYTLEEDGTPFLDFLSDVIDGVPPESVLCTDCSPPE